MPAVGLAVAASVVVAVWLVLTFMSLAVWLGSIAAALVLAGVAVGVVAIGVAWTRTVTRLR